MEARRSRQRECWEEKKKTRISNLQRDKDLDMWKAKERMPMWRGYDYKVSATINIYYSRQIGPAYILFSVFDITFLLYMQFPWH